MTINKKLERRLKLEHLEKLKNIDTILNTQLLPVLNLKIDYIHEKKDEYFLDLSFESGKTYIGNWILFKNNHDIVVEKIRKILSDNGFYCRNLKVEIRTLDSVISTYISEKPKVSIIQKLKTFWKT